MDYCPRVVFSFLKPRPVVLPIHGSQIINFTFCRILLNTNSSLNLRIQLHSSPMVYLLWSISANRKKNFHVVSTRGNSCFFFFFTFFFFLLILCSPCTTLSGKKGKVDQAFTFQNQTVRLPQVGSLNSVQLVSIVWSVKPSLHNVP